MRTLMPSGRSQPSKSRLSRAGQRVQPNIRGALKTTFAVLTWRQAGYYAVWALPHGRLLCNWGAESRRLPPDQRFETAVVLVPALLGLIVTK